MRYQKMFEANEKNGSFYLQSKVHRAKERMEAEFKGEGGDDDEGGGGDDEAAGGGGGEDGRARGSSDGDAGGGSNPNAGRGFAAGGVDPKQ